MRKNLRRNREKKQFTKMLAQINSTRSKATPGVCKKKAPGTGSTEEPALRLNQRAKSCRGFIRPKRLPVARHPRTRRLAAFPGTPSGAGMRSAAPELTRPCELADPRREALRWALQGLVAGEAIPCARSSHQTRHPALAHSLRLPSGPRVGSPNTLAILTGSRRLETEGAPASRVWRRPQGHIHFPRWRHGRAPPPAGACAFERARLPSPGPSSSLRDSGAWGIGWVLGMGRREGLTGLDLRLGGRSFRARSLWAHQSALSPDCLPRRAGSLGRRGHQLWPPAGRREQGPARAALGWAG